MVLSAFMVSQTDWTARGGIAGDAKLLAAPLFHHAVEFRRIGAGHQRSVARAQRNAQMLDDLVDDRLIGTRIVFLHIGKIVGHGETPFGAMAAIPMAGPLDKSCCANPLPRNSRCGRLQPILVKSIPQRVILSSGGDVPALFILKTSAYMWGAGLTGYGDKRPL